ncbi:MAG: hypothetical protein ACLRP8_08995 [Roseburia intestinalis]
MMLIVYFRYLHRKTHYTVKSELLINGFRKTDGSKTADMLNIR